MKTFLLLPKSIQRVLIALSVVTIVSIITLTVFIMRPHISGTASQTSNIDVKQVVSDINKAMLLPSDETPNISAVADASSLKTEAFFAQAETGDLVVVYPTSKRAILWRPTIKKIIEISTINVQ